LGGEDDKKVRGEKRIVYDVKRLKAEKIVLLTLLIKVVYAINVKNLVRSFGWVKN